MILSSILKPGQGSQGTTLSFLVLLVVSLVANISVDALAPPMMVWNPFKSGSKMAKQEDQPVIDRFIRPGDVIWTPGKSSTHDFDFSPFGIDEMGGISKCFFNNTSGVWNGVVENDSTGGLIGVRSTPDVCYNCYGCVGFAIKAKVVKVGGSTKIGKPLSLKFKSRNSIDPLDGLTFTTLVEAKLGEESIWYIPFKEQTPTQWSRMLPGEEFNINIVSGFKFVYSKIKYNDEICPHFELGDFEMKIDEIVAY